MPEIFQTLFSNKKCKIQRIISHGETTEKGKWLKEAHDEWVMVLKGEGWLRFHKDGRLRKLKAGDHIFIPKNTLHRVEWTPPKRETVWLAVYFAATR